MKETVAVNSLERIRENLKNFDRLAPYPLEPFWGHMMPDFGADPYWGKGSLPLDRYQQVLFVSGPGRNGNHLVHSMLDDHPELPRIAGEDSFIAAFFNDLIHQGPQALERLRGEGNVDYILNLSGYGCNKWKLTARSGAQGNRKTDVWSGVHGATPFVHDYQDTLVSVDYEAYESRLCELAPEIRKAPTFVDVFWMYLEASRELDPLKRKTTIPYLCVGSGLRAEMEFLCSRVPKIFCVAPIRPFENFYFSFAKGRKKSDQITPVLLQEAWEHWWHKVVDYLVLKKEYPDMICLVNFQHLINDPEATAREICRFLRIDYSDTCLTPTTMGVPTKGNSSFPKTEAERGKFYKESLERNLPKRYWPDLYRPLWKMVSELAV